MLDEYLPEYQFSEYHETEVLNLPELVYPIIRTMDFRRSRTIRALFALRGLPRKAGTIDDFIRLGFLMLEERAGEEILIGFVAGRGGLLALTPHEFREFSSPGHIKCAWNFMLTEKSGRTVLSTETRVSCTSLGARALFAVYWVFVAPFSGLIRTIMLKMIKDEAQRQAG